MGDNIAEGELIASLDPRDFRSDVVKQERICNMHMQISIVQKSWLRKTLFQNLNMID